MALALSDNQARLLRLRAQQLAPPRGRPAAGVARVVRGLVGVQAQDSAAAALAIRARRAGLVVADVERALAEERSIVRTWGMRGTLHLVAAEDAGWLLGLLGPVFSRATRGRQALEAEVEDIRYFLSAEASLTVISRVKAPGARVSTPPPSS